MSLLASSSVSIVNVNDGQDGVGIVSTIIEYAVSSSGTIPPGNALIDESGNELVSNQGDVLTDGNWSATIPTISEGYFLWTRTRFILSNGTFDMVYAVAYQGEEGLQGVSVVSEQRQYRLSDSSTELTGSGVGYSWQTEKPTVSSGQYIWERVATTLSNNNIIYSDAVCDIVTSGLVFDVDRNSNAITSKVWESDITSKINQYDGSTGAAIRDRVTQTETSITGITSRVSDVESETDSLGTRMTSAESSITQNANNITTKVSKDGVISSINQSAETIKISASKVNIEGAVTFSSFDSTLQNRLTTAESDASTAKSNASSAVSTANTASSNASSALTKVNNSIKSTTMHYLATSASSGVTTSTSGWTTTIQSITKDKPYLWTYQTITKINDTTSNTDPVISGVYGATGGKGDTGTGVTKVEQLYRTSNSTTAPAAPTSAVSSTSTSYNTWTLAMPTYNTSYPYYYICTQTTYDNGTVKWTTVSRSKALEDANSTANTANTNASNAVSTANTANTNASNAVSTANTANTNASNAVSTANQAKSKADSAASLLSTWTGDATLATTIINGGYIKTHTIESTHLATNAIMSQNYQASPNAQSPYSAVGTFLDLSTGSLYMPQFGVDGTTGAAYFNGQVNADSGKFGDDNSYWNIETVIDYNATSHAALVGAGNPYLQTGNWQISDNAVATRKYVSTSETAGTASYYKDTGTNTFYDVGMKIPTSFTVGNDSNEDRYHRAFFYQRRYTGSTAPALDSSWNYPFIVDNEGRVYCTDLIIIGGGSGTTYLPLAGGTITGNLAVNGSFTTNLMLRTNLGSTSASYLTGNAQAIVDHGVTGTLGVGNGGTGKTTWTANGVVYASASNALSQLGTGTSGQLLKSNGNAAPGWVNQSSLSVGTATKATQDSDGNAINTTYRKLDNNSFDSADITSLNAGYLIVTGAARFANGLYGTLTGTATSVSNSLKIQLNSGTTEGTNQFTYNGSAAKTVNITKSSIGLGNVENTALSTWAGSANLTTAKVGTLAGAAVKAVDTSISAASTSANLPTSAAVATFVEGKGYVTSSGVTSVRVQATSPVVSSTNTAQSSTLNTTISLADAYGDTKNPYGTKTANYVLAGPSSGSAAAPSFRALVAADIPSITKSKISDFPTTWALGSVTGADDLKAIEALTGTSGMLKKTAANTWALTTVITDLSISDDVITYTKSDATTGTLTVNVTGQIVTKATVLSDASGNAISLGSASAPVYFSNGAPAQANTIPSVSLNGSATTSASFYAPSGAGTSGQYLKSSGTGAPTWETFSKSTVGLGNVDNTADSAKRVKGANITTTANAVAKYSDTSGTFADSNVRIEDNNLIVGETDGSGTITGAGNIIIGAKNDSYGILPSVNNWNSIGLSGRAWYRAYIMNYYGTNSFVANWQAGNNIGAAVSANTNAVLGNVNFYNVCAAGGTQTKTNLTANSATNSNITITLPSSTGTLALTSSSITGNAATATKWASAQTVYVALGTASKTTSIQGGSSSAVALGVDGVLGVGNGGTGAASFTANSVIMSGSTTTGAFTTRAVTNNTSASAVTANTNLITANTLAYWTGSSNLTTCSKGTFGTMAVASASDYLKLSGGTMTGTITSPHGKEALHFPSTNDSYGAGFIYGINNNEALAIAIKHSTTSFMVVHGSDPATWGDGTWGSAAPTIQTKNKSLYVNELISNSATPAYNFKVNGASYLGGEVRFSHNNTDTESVSLKYNNTTKSLDFVFN